MRLGDAVTDSVVDRIRSHVEQIIESEQLLFYSNNWVDPAKADELPREVWEETRRNRVEQIAELERLGKACIAEAGNINFDAVAVTRALDELYSVVYALGNWAERDDDLANGRNVRRLGVRAHRNATEATIRLPIKPPIAEQPSSPSEPPIQVVGRELCLFSEIGRIQKSLAAPALVALAVRLESLQSKGKENCSVKLGGNPLSGEQQPPGTAKKGPLTSMPATSVVFSKLADDLADVAASNQSPNDALAGLQLSTQALEQILEGHMHTICGEANAIFRDLTKADNGIDGELEFRDKDGNASGRKIYVQLRSGDSHLRLRQVDGKLIFDVKKHRHLHYWQSQPCDVWLVIRDGHGTICWMNLTQYLRNRPNKACLQIEFDGSPLTASAIRLLGEAVIPPSNR